MLARNLGIAAALCALVLVDAGGVRADVVFNELMYHAYSATKVDDADFIEFHNTSAAPVDLSDWCVGGISFCFPPGATIDASGYLVIGRTAAGFQAAYGFAPDFVFEGTLSNGGETLTLTDASQTLIDEVTYSDKGLWPPKADGLGPSLERIDPLEPGDTPRNWRASTAVGGDTARAPNSVNAVGLPPWITSPAHTVDPSPSQPVIVTAAIEDASTVTLYYKIGFGAETSIPMLDDGLSNDGAASDGVYGATIPGQPVGTLIRYRILADGLTGQMQFPRVDDTVLYDGTVVNDASVVTALPRFQWFVDPAVYQQALTHYQTDVTELAVFYYDGKLFDNIEFRVRGQKSREFPKKNWRFYMPQGHDFFDASLIPVPFDKFNLQGNYSDKSFVREILAYETFRDAGASYCRAFPVRLEQNGTFYGLYTFGQTLDDDYLTTNNLDENAAWYKAYSDLREMNLFHLTNSYAKQSRLYENHQDLLDLDTAINNLTGTADHNYLFDNINLPEMANFLAANCILHNNDQVAKNYFLYRDTEGTGRWHMQAWDMDLTLGRNYGAGAAAVLCDGIWADNDDIGRPGTSPSHPLFGDDGHQKFDNLWNRLYRNLYRHADFRAMYYRRLRTLIDQMLATTYYEDRIAELLPQIAPEAALDVLRPWGQYGQQQTITQAAALITDDYLPRRRTHLMVTHRVANEIPGPQSPSPKVVINEIMYNPIGGSDHDFIELYNPSTSEAIDMSGWRLDGVALTFTPGTVILSDNYLLVVKSDKSFRMNYGSGKFVAAQFSGQLSDTGEALTLYNQDGGVVDVVEYEAVAPWPAAANAGGSSLELRDASQENNRVSAWASSLNPGGTPGAANSTLAPLSELPDLFVNEVLVENIATRLDEAGDPDPWVEIYNPGDASIDVGGFFISDDYQVPNKWMIPADTLICGKSWLLFWLDGEPAEGQLHAGFRLTATSGSVALFAQDGAIIDYLNYVSGNSDVPFGRYPDGGPIKMLLPRSTPESANQSSTSALILNEYNGVSSSKFLKDGGVDTYFGHILGNGGDWFELVVTQDHLDIRNWQLEVRDNVGLAGETLDVLQFTSDPIWADLRSGTIITVSEDVVDDVGYAPENGDWWINVRANNTATGQYITADSFPVSNDNWQLTIRDDAGHLAFGPAGEGVQPLSGIGSDEVFKLEADPSAFTSAHSNYNDGTSSSFGSPNVYGGGLLSQDFSLLRDVFQACVDAGQCDDGDPCTIDSCEEGECRHDSIASCNQIALRLLNTHPFNPNVVARTGDLVSVAVDVSGLSHPVNAVEMVIEYDPARLDFVSASPGDQAGSPWDAASVVIPGGDIGPGRVAYSLSLDAGSTQLDATAATLVFEVMSDDLQDQPTSLSLSTACLPAVNRLTTVSDETLHPTLVDSAMIITGEFPTVLLSAGDCSSCIRAPGTSTVLVRVSQLSDAVNGVQVLMTYDPAILGVPTVEMGDGAGSPWDSAILTALLPQGSHLTFAASLLGTQSAADAVVARLHFPVIGVGTSEIGFRADAPPFRTLLTRAADNTKIYPYKQDSVWVIAGQTTKADVNGDGERDGADVQAFVNVAMAPGAAAPAEFCAADMDSDGSINSVDDIVLFVDCLLTGQCVCP